MQGSPRGKGECWQETITHTGKSKPAGLDALKANNCKKWKLLEMGQMKGRSKREFIWDARNIVTLGALRG